MSATVPPPGGTRESGDEGVLLRDRTHITRLLVLREFHVHGRRTLREVADALGVTVQAVSTYARGLAGDGLLAERRAGYAVTPRGLQFMQEGFTRLRRAVDDALSPLAVIEVTSALAAERVRAGDAVGLFMEEGDLVARRADSTSRGRAVTDATPGEEVIVGDLAGVVALEPGRLVVVQVPGPIEGGSHRVRTEDVHDALEQSGLADARVAVHGTGAKAVARAAGLTVHFQFASVEAAFNAAERGLPVVLLVTRDLVRDALAAIEERNARTLRSVPVDIVDLPLTGDAPTVRAPRTVPVDARKRRRRG